jgi:maleylpyruvate isomerase
VRLHSYWRSSSAWRVRIALGLKGLPYELVPVHLVRDGGQQHGAAFREKNPMGQVPVLEVDGIVLTQSMAILEYLEETRPAPPLLPRDPAPRARVRQLAEIVNSGIQPLQNMHVQQVVRAAGADPLPLVRRFIEEGLVALEALARTTAGAFLVGDAPTFADVLLVPQLYSARRNAVELAPYPTLLRAEAACAALPAFAAAHADAQPDREP